MKKKCNALLAGGSDAVGSDAVASLWLNVPPEALLDWLYITGKKYCLV